jgi:hypothetical protein
MTISKKELNRQFNRIRENDRSFTKTKIAESIGKLVQAVSLCFSQGAYLDTLGIEIKKYMDKVEKELRGKK